MKKNRNTFFFNGRDVIIIKEKSNQEKPYDLEVKEMFFQIGDEFKQSGVGNSLRKIYYPTSIHYYFDDTLPMFDEEQRWIPHSSFINAINYYVDGEENKKDTEYYYFDCVPSGIDYHYITNSISKKGKKGCDLLQKELIELIGLLGDKEKTLLFFNELLISKIDSKGLEVHFYPSTRKVIEEDIRNKNYFLSKYKQEQIDKIVDAVIEEIVSSKRDNECIFQDTLILITDEMYRRYEEELKNEMHKLIIDFYSNNKDVVLMDFIFSKTINKMFIDVIDSINEIEFKFVNILNVLDVLLDYRKLKLSVSSAIYNNSNKTLPYRLLGVDDEFIRKNAYIKNVEKTDFRNRLKRIIDKLSRVNMCFGKEELLLVKEPEQEEVKC